MAPASTVLTQSTIAKGGELFPVILLYLHRLCPEVYGPAVSLGQAPAGMEFPLGEDEE